MYGKTGGKNVQLVLQHCWKTSSKAMMCVLPPTLKPSLQQIRLLQVVWILTSDWIKLRGSHAIPRTYVTCCKTGSPAQHVQILLQEKIELLSTLQQNFEIFHILVCCETGLIRKQYNAQHRYLTRFAAILQNKLHYFVDRFTVALCSEICSDLNGREEHLWCREQLIL